MKLQYYNDGKEKFQSHEISLVEDNFYNKEYDIVSYNPFDIVGYGATKEEAIEDFKKKFVFVMAELKSFENKLLSINDIEV